MAEQRKPTVDDVGELRDALRAFFGANQFNQKIMDLLFEQWQAGGPPTPLHASEIAEMIHYPGDDPIRRRDAVRQRIGRMRVELKTFAPSRRRPWGVTIDHDSQGYIVSIRYTDIAPPPDDLLAHFWAPYRNDGEHARIIYPEPLFFLDRNHTYFRNRATTHPGNKRALGYLHLGPLKATPTFVQAGVVRAMLDLFACLENLDVPYTATPTRWGQTMSDHQHPENLIVLGTGSSNPLIETLEEKQPYRTRTDGVERVSTGKARMFQDENQEDLSGTKYALLTRTPHRLSGRVITILTGEHGRTVHALAEFLTHGENLRRLVDEFDPSDDGPFPPAFQALFQVEMIETGAEPHIQSILPLEVATIRGRGFDRGLGRR